MLEKRVFHQTAEATGDLISNKMFMKLQSLKTSTQNTSASVREEKENMELHKEIPKERSMAPEKRHVSIEDLN